MDDQFITMTYYNLRGNVNKLTIVYNEDTMRVEGRVKHMINSSVLSRQCFYLHICNLDIEDFII